MATTTPTKVRVFIGSSAEALPLARALGSKLQYDAVVTLWDDAFPPGSVTLTAILAEARKYDFAVLVLTPDDQTRSRGHETSAPRDNAVLEFGMFLAILGPERAFMVYNRDRELKIPSDLKGITPITFPAREPPDVFPMVAPAATQLIEAFKKLGPFKSTRVGAVYWAAPHGNINRGAQITKALSQWGFEAFIPGELVKLRLPGGSQRQPASAIRDICIDAISRSQTMIVDLDYYGLDSAWELGFAESLGLRICGVSLDQGIGLMHRRVNRRPWRDNFMHGWTADVVMSDLTAIAAKCVGKRVHVCGSFSREADFAALRDSEVAKTASQLVLPKDVLELGKSFPKDYPFSGRRDAIRLLEECDIALVLLPQYGMDTAWQIGYAAGKGKALLGWDTGRLEADYFSRPVWDHWMHGWKEKPVFLELDDCIAFLVGLRQMGLLGSATPTATS